MSIAEFAKIACTGELIGAAPAEFTPALDKISQLAGIPLRGGAILITRIRNTVLHTQISRPVGRHG
ncbi:hypothetical protein [Mycolicibacterium peregrinum]|uniref:hypothetical protein n=1 Tax=Mycolicibacterium peregrinum TaxID=43304 RepID=UPI0010427839|nr:hypothetical protein [Mycolicibacterium peregrinum]